MRGTNAGTITNGLVDGEVDDHVPVDRDGSAALHCRFIPILIESTDRLLVEPKTERRSDADVGDRSILPDHKAECDIATQLQLAGNIAIGCLGLR